MSGFTLILILAFSGVVAPVTINTQDWPLVYKSQAQLMCESTHDPWACGVWAQGLMLPSPEEVKRSPASADLINKGLTFYMEKKYDEAIQAFNKAIELYPQSSEGWSNRGIALKHQGKYDEAIQAYNKTIELDPKFKYAWYNKGNILYEKGKYDEAIQAYNKTIQIDPKYAYAWYSKGNVLEKLGLAAESKEAHTKAKELGYTG